MTDKHDKLVEMARECGCVIGENGPDEQFEVSFHAAQLAAFRDRIVASLCADVEPVAEIMSAYAIHWCGSDPIAPTVRKHGLRVGSHLYADSTVAAITAQRDAALARVAELEKDAARYRWLRDKAVWLTTSEKAPWCVIGTCANDAQPCDRDELDTAIDAALTKGQS